MEAPGDSYTWTGPAATFSGLPGVIGPDHQEKFRSPDAYRQQVEHVDAIYTGEWADAARHLERYDVTHVYVGPNVRERYGDELRSFDRDVVTVDYEDDAVTIPKVDQVALDSEIVSGTHR